MKSRPVSGEAYSRRMRADERSRESSSAENSARKLRLNTLTPRRKLLRLKERHVGLRRDMSVQEAQQQEQQDGKRDAEADADRIAENFARVARGKKAHSSHWTPSPASLIKASSKRVSPAAAHSSCAVPQIRSLPCDRMPMRSESASASSR